MSGGAHVFTKAASGENKRYFYSDTTGLRSLVKGAWRTMDAVFKRSGVKGAHPHRFRHTLASELLGKGGDIDKVAAILADTAAIKKKNGGQGRNRTADASLFRAAYRQS